MPVHYDTIIIGAGLSGMTAALKLAGSSNSILVLEASNKVGGRTNTIQAENGACVDLGGTFVGSTHVKLKNIIEQLGLTLIDQHDKGNKIMVLSKERRIEYSRNIPTLPLLPRIDLNLNLRDLETKAKKVSVINPSLTSHSELWDSYSLETWKQQNMWTYGARQSLNQICRSLLGCEPCEVSFLYFLFFVKSNFGLDEKLHDLTGLMMLMDNNVKDKRVKDGAQQICEMIVQKIGHKNVLLEHSVVEIDYEDDHCVTVHTLDIDKKVKEFKATSVIIAIPPTPTKNITFSPPLPIEKATLLDRIYTGSYTKCIVFYDRAFWRYNGYSGTVVCAYNNPDFPITEIHDCTDENAKFPALSISISSITSIEFSKLSRSKQEDKIIDSLVHIFGQDASSATNIIIKEWGKDEYNHGGTVALLPPGTCNMYGTTLRAPVKSMFWAGTESASFGCGFMEGAVEAGERAAMEVQNFLALQLLDTF